jgi:hypothetical protein
VTSHEYILYIPTVGDNYTGTFLDSYAVIEIVTRLVYWGQEKLFEEKNQR